MPIDIIVGHSIRNTDGFQPPAEWRRLPNSCGLSAWFLSDGRRILDVAVEALQDGCLVSAPPSQEPWLYLAASIYAG